jgi:hypothetical protein
MKRLALVTTFAMIAISCQDIPGPDLATKVQFKETAAAAESDGLDLLWGPQEFIRTRGKPTAETVAISKPDFEHFVGPFVLHVQNGDGTGKNRVSSAWIALDGQDLFGPPDFSQQIVELSAEVSLTDGSLLEVKIASKPGSRLTIWIEARLELLNVVNLWAKVDDLPLSRTEYVSVWASSAENVWIGDWKSRFLHFDGDSWQVFQAPGQSAVNKIWGASEDQVWATTQYDGLMYYDGSSWTQLFPWPSYLLGVWGASASNVYVTTSPGGHLHFDGTTWESTNPQIANPEDDPLGFDRMYGATRDVSGSSATDVWMLTSNRIYHFDGAEWRLAHHSVPDKSVSSAGPDRAWVAGPFRTAALVDPVSIEVVDFDSSYVSLDRIHHSQTTGDTYIGGSSSLLAYKPDGKEWQWVSYEPSTSLAQPVFEGIWDVGDVVYAVAHTASFRYLQGFVWRGYRGARIELPGKVELAVGSAMQLSPSFLDGEGNPIPDSPLVEWSSTDPSVVAVDEEGRIVAVGTGTAAVEIKAKGGATGSTAVTVN